jgi:hypothetical protein
MKQTFSDVSWDLEELLPKSFNFNRRCSKSKSHHFLFRSNSEKRQKFRITFEIVFNLVKQGKLFD